MPPASDEPFPDDQPDAIIALAAAALGAPIPEACAPGVIDNARLLRRHWMTLREAMQGETRA